MKKCSTSDIDKVLEYIGDDYARCPYLYVDVVKYGLTSENVELWVSNGDKIDAIVLRYYNGAHLYSRNNTFDPLDITATLTSFYPQMICGMQETIDVIWPYIQGYEIEVGQVLILKHYTGKYNEDAYKASREDYRDIAGLLATDEVMGKPYGFDLLYKQLLERYDDGFGRSWVKRDDRGVVANSATYAEVSDLAIVSGGIVRPDKRGMGEYSRQLGSLCKDLISEGKSVISFAYGGSAEQAHYSVGFEKAGDWAKLIRA